MVNWREVIALVLGIVGIFFLTVNVAVSYAYSYIIETPFFRFITDDRAMALGVILILLGILIYKQLDRYLLERTR